MELDIIIPIKSDSLKLAIELTIPSILTHLSFNKIYILTKLENFEMINLNFEDSVILLNEDKVCEGITFQKVSEYLKNKIDNTSRTGWYFQQFIKLGISKNTTITSNYLVWDADAVVLKQMNFINDKKQIFITKSDEHHQPYFNTLEKLINIKKQVKFSFISEHMIFNKECVVNLINIISKKDAMKIWWEIILDTIEVKHLNKSGFSEYETYGNYLMSTSPSLLKIRFLPNFRSGKELLGEDPSRFLLKLLSIEYYYISFESFQKTKYSFPLKQLKVLYLLLLAKYKKINFIINNR